MRSVVRLAAIAFLVTIAACASPPPEPSPTPGFVPTASLAPVTSPSASAVTATARSSTPASETACLVTLPNGSTPPGEAASPLNHGESGIWTVLWPDGTVIVPPDNVDAAGVLWTKFPWWRGPGVVGPLKLWGRALPSGAMVLSDIPDGYGSTGFQASGLGFPTPGCYEITAIVGDARLTLATRVRMGAG
jgi:hypothetical protein